MPVRFNLPVLGECEQRLFHADRTTDTLYHYTSIPAFMKIVTDRCLNLSDIRYMNDASEISYGLDLIKDAETSAELTNKNESPAAVLIRIMVGIGTYVGCFSTHGSRLSQWRGYCDRGQGVSIGFRADALRAVAGRQDFALGRCVYNIDDQRAIVAELLSAVGFAPDGEWNQTNVPLDMSKEAITRDQRLVGSMPRIAALLKNPLFDEEGEWRLISHINVIALEGEAQYRPGRTMVIPYWCFNLPERPDGSLDIDHIWIGPTTHPDESEQSMMRFLVSQKAKPTRGLSYCGIPLREL